jgi:E3 ubiquitin-protein ligase TRIP12
MSELTSAERLLFVRFVTGSHILPSGGFAALRPQLTVARAVVEGEGFLPSVMTCANFLKVPEYSTKEKLRSQLLVAITEGQGCFHLS